VVELDRENFGGKLESDAKGKGRPCRRDVKLTEGTFQKRKGSK